MSESPTRRSGSHHLPGVRAAAVLLAVLAAAPASAQAGGDLWRLSAARFKRMDPFERAQYQRAARAFEQGDYRTAAAEFGKFRSQFDDCVNLSHMILMQGRSLHRDKKRNEAIRIYNQVLDYFAHVTADAAPALYYQGVAQMQNGDVLKGLSTLNRMVEHERYRRHPRTAGALRRLADYYVEHGKPAKAVGYWKQTVADFDDANSHQARRARARLTKYYIATGDYAAYEEWIVDPEHDAPGEHRRWVTDYAWSRAYHREGDWRELIGEGVPVARRRREFWDYFTGGRRWWEQTGRLWDYYRHALNYAAFRLDDDEALKRIVDQAVAHVREDDAAERRDDRLWWLADRLSRADKFLRARHCLEQMDDRHRARYGEYVMLARQRKYAEAADVLKGIIAGDDADGAWTARAEKDLARLYHHHLGKHAEAIKLYRTINQPPGTVWAVADCYARMGKLEQALTKLLEIENAFPSEASKAAWRRVKLLSGDDKARAIAEARRVLKVYPESSESSQAHQYLEKQGIATGGAVIDEN
ncbi:MAG: tetratricopeptide repeat protein [Planctomycetota bacterium]